jgi:hypothetical protein
MKDYLIKDINGNKIKENEIFDFTFTVDLDTDIELSGYLYYNDEDLAYEVDVINNDYYKVLTYATTHIYMSNIRLVTF